MPHLPLLLLCLLLAAPAQTASAAESLVLATWNLEWLASAPTLATLRQRCLAPQRTAALPCDVPQLHARSSADFARLAHYARRLGADVIALQEVEDAATARRVFDGYRFCFTGRHDLQNVGFAIRAGLPHRCGADLVDLSLRDSVRRGAELLLWPGTRREIRLLAIHLKSGCARDALESARAACRTLRRQVPALEAWIDAQARAGRPFAVLGDFNRDLQQDARDGSGLWAQLDDGDPSGLRLRNAADGQRFSNCVTGQAFTSFIDYVVLGGALTQAFVPGSFAHPGYLPADARHYRLSDHCPVVLQLRLPMLPG